VLAALAAAEWVTWRASTDVILSGRRDPGNVSAGEVVLVLGYRSRADGRPSAMQRWRTRVAVRSTSPTIGRIVFSGGRTTGGRSEAAVMAEYAINRLHVPRSAIDLEEQADTTWENVAFTLPQLKQATQVKIASNTFHARRARRYALKQAPELAARLQRARDYKLGEWSPIKLLLVAYEWRRVAAERRRA
jgi:uncharacterized SAM-binding protein YcdF (DUF218 family)